MGDRGGTARSAKGDSSVNQVNLVTHSRNLPMVDGKMLPMKKKVHNFLRAYDTYCRRTEEDPAVDVQYKLSRMSELLSCSQKDVRSLSYFWRP